jgi:hypothetical protein
MPYKTPDRDAIRVMDAAEHPAPGLNAAEAAVTRETDHTTHDSVSALLRELAPTVKAAADAKAADAVAQLQTTTQFSSMADAGLSVRAAWRAFEDARVRISQDGNLSAAGRDDAIRRAAEQRDASIATVADSTMSVAGDALLRMFPGTPFPALSADLAAHATFIMTAADTILPETLLQQAAELLRIATDSDAPRDDSTRATRLLDAAYLPLLTRYAGSPPKHWTRWSGLAHDLAGLIASHVDTVFGRPYHRVAVGAVAAFRRDFSFMAGTVRELGRWDDVVLIGTESFRRAA